MMIDPRSREADAARRARQFRKDVLHLHRAEVVILDGGDGFACDILRIGEDLLDVVDRRDRRLHFLECFDNLLEIVLSDPAADNRIDSIQLRR